jgi:ParB family chromosome partitioning protein
MQIAPEAILIRKRVRRSLGNLEPLMESLKKYGQLNPIIINRSYELIAGRRRLEAAKLLGWSSVQVVVIDSSTEKEKLEIELEENVQRAPLSEQELTEAFTRLERLNRPPFWRRLWNFLKRLLARLTGPAGPAGLSRRRGRKR